METVEAQYNLTNFIFIKGDRALSIFYIIIDINIFIH